MGQQFEPGQYRARVTRWTLIKAKTGTPQFALSFMPLGKINVHNPDGDLLPCPEVERTIFRPITDKTADWVLQDLEQLFGYADKRFSPLDPESPDAFDFGSKEFTAVLTFEDRMNPDTGEITKANAEKWKFVAGQGQLSGDPLSATEIRQLDTLFGAAKPKKNGKKPKTPPAAPLPVPVGQDIPI